MKSYFKFLSRNKLYTAIEAFGLSIALAFVMIWYPTPSWSIGWARISQMPRISMCLVRAITLA